MSSSSGGALVTQYTPLICKPPLSPVPYDWATGSGARLPSEGRIIQA